MFETAWLPLARSRPPSYSDAYDWEILCHWCRERHLASGVTQCMALKRPVLAGETNGSCVSTLSRGQLLADYSELWAFLTGTTWPDGKPRVPGSMSFRLAHGRLQGTLTENSPAAYLTRVADSMDELLLALEMALQEENPGWRASSFGKGRK